MNYSKTLIGGYLTRDPELRYLQTGTPVANGCVATNRTWKDAAGNEQSEVLFLDFQAWAGTAENMSKYLHKGDPIFLEGHLKQENWEDKQTQAKRSKIVLVVERMQFLAKSNGKSEKGATKGPPPPAREPVQPSDNDGGAPIDDDDKPPF